MNTFLTKIEHSEDILRSCPINLLDWYQLQKQWMGKNNDTSTLIKQETKFNVQKMTTSKNNLVFSLH